MVSDEGIAAGLALIGAAMARTVTAEQASVYRLMCAEHFADDADFLNAVKAAIERESKAPWITPGMLLAGRIGQVDAATEIEAGKLFTEIERHGMRYSPHGSRYDTERIRERWGVRALEAFQAAGGNAAFQATDDRALGFVRRDFIRAYVEAGREEQRALPAGRELRLIGAVR